MALLLHLVHYLQGHTHTHSHTYIHTHIHTHRCVSNAQLLVNQLQTKNQIQISSDMHKAERLFSKLVDKL